MRYLFLRKLRRKRGTILSSQKKGTVIFGVGTECSEIMLTNGAGSQATFSFQFQTLLN